MMHTKFYENGWNVLQSYEFDSAEELQEFARGFNEAVEAWAEFLADDEAVKRGMRDRLDRLIDEINEIEAASGCEVVLSFDYERNAREFTLVKDRSRAPKRLGTGDGSEILF